MTNPHNIYIHVPYCISKCRYCAFFSRACANPDWGAYADGIVSEINTWAGRMGRITVPTVFFGGGTPSLMPTDVFGRIMDTLRRNFTVAPDAEITLEANPGTIDARRLDAFVACGVNRLSIGVQSLNDDELRYLGRRHDAATALGLIEAAMKIGLNVSADFIYALPGWGVQNVRDMCERINGLGLRHCSLYELTIEDGTPLALSRPDMPSNDAMADMYCAIDRYLALPRYEVSNHAAPGFECRHNANVWDGDAYIGIGTGAAGRVYFQNQWYEQTGGHTGTFAPMSDTDRAIERIITGLRTTRGVRIDNETAKIINMQYVTDNAHLVRIRDGRLGTTARGRLILDDILSNLVV